MTSSDPGGPVLEALRRHRTVVLVLALVLALAGLVLVENRQADDSARSAARADRLVVQTTLAGLTEQYVGFSAAEVAQGASERTWQLRPGSAVDRAALVDWLADAPLGFVGAVLATASGTPLVASGRVPARAADAALRPIAAGLRAGRPGVSDLVRTPRGPLVGFAVPVAVAGQVRGLLTAYADPRSWRLQGYVTHLRLGSGARYGVLDSAGTVVASSEPEEIGRPAGLPPVSRSDLREVGGDVVSQAPMGPLGWRSTTAQPRAAFYAALGHARQLLPVALVALIGAVLVGVLVLDARRRRALDRLAAEAIFDPLTGAATRRMLDLRLTGALARHRRHCGRLGLLFLDLDGFKPVNDQLGHAAGDEVLREVVARIRGQLREEDFLARVGGDEFVVLLEQLDSAEQAEDVARRLVAAVSAPISARGRDVVVGVSVGVATTEQRHAEGDALVAAADAAMYRAKEAGGSYRVVRLEHDPLTPTVTVRVPEARSARDVPTPLG